MSQKSCLKRVLFGWYSIDTFHSGSRRFLSRSVFHQSKISYIYKRDFFYHLQVLTFIHLMPLIVFDLDRGCCPYSSPNDTPCVPSSSWLIPPWGDVRSLYPPYGWRGYSLSSRDQIIGVRFHTYIYEYDKYFSKRKRLEDIQILRMNIISKSLH